MKLYPTVDLAPMFLAFLRYINRKAHETNRKLQRNYLLPMCTILGHSLVSTHRENTTPSSKFKEFAREIRKLKVAPEEDLRLYDVSVLFTSIPLNKVLVFIKERCHP